MRRRTFLQGGVSIAAASCLAGCSSVFPRGTIDLHVLNWSFEEQTFEVTITNSGGNSKYGEELTLQKGGSIYKDDILTRGAYTVTVSVGEEITRDYEFEMGECEKQEITIIYESPTELEIHRKQC